MLSPLGQKSLSNFKLNAYLTAYRILLNLKSDPVTLIRQFTI